MRLQYHFLQFLQFFSTAFLSSVQYRVFSSDFNYFFCFFIFLFIFPFDRLLRLFAKRIDMFLFILAFPLNVVIPGRRPFKKKAFRTISYKASMKKSLSYYFIGEYCMTTTFSTNVFFRNLSQIGFDSNKKAVAVLVT